MLQGWVCFEFQVQENPIQQALTSDLENYCVCWTGREFIFTPLCLYAQLSNTFVLPWEPRFTESARSPHKFVLDASRAPTKKTQFYPQAKIENRFTPYRDPLQVLVLPYCWEFSGTPVQLIRFIDELMTGEFSPPMKTWMGHCMIEGDIREPNPGDDDLETVSHRIPSLIVSLLRKVSEATGHGPSDGDLFDLFMEYQDKEEDYIQQTLHFEPSRVQVSSGAWDLRKKCIQEVPLDPNRPWANLVEAKYKQFRLPKYPLALFLVDPGLIMRYPHSSSSLTTKLVTSLSRHVIC